MAYNLEARAPYLDSRVIKFAFGLPVQQKIKYFQGKYILKRVAQRYIPGHVVWRRKHGFDLPLDDWFRHDLKPFLSESLEHLYPYRNIFSMKHYNAVISEHIRGQANHGNKLWSMIILGNWLHRHKIHD